MSKNKTFICDICKIETIKTGNNQKYCDECKKEGKKKIAKLDYENNKETIIKQQKMYRDENKEEINLKRRENYKKPDKKEKVKNYYENNKDEILRKRKIFDNKQENKLKRKIYKQENKEEIRIKDKIYETKNKDKITKRKREHRRKPEVKKRESERIKERRRNDPGFDIMLRLRNHSYNGINSYTKNGKIMSSDQYGIDRNAISKHLEPFPENRKEYEIDHIRPLCSFKFDNEDGSPNLEQIQIAYAPENHQWLTIEDHKIKTALDIHKSIHRK